MARIKRKLMKCNVPMTKAEIKEGQQVDQLYHTSRQILNKLNFLKSELSDYSHSNSEIASSWNQQFFSNQDLKECNKFMKEQNSLKGAIDSIKDKRDLLTSPQE